jgi:putative protease
VDRGIDAVIVQDVGLVRLIRRLYPDLEVHGSTQMTVHDASGARVARRLGVSRVVLARENTLDDIRSIKAAVPDVGVEAFVHGALCISYSGQCYMSGMISERSANRGSCAQSCRKDYVLADRASGQELDRGYLISARDLGAYDQLADLAAAGVECLKVEGRKKRPEYVATVSRTYRTALDRLGRGEPATLAPSDVEPLVQIYSRGFTTGMLTGRVGREYVTRDQPDNRGVPLGVVTRSRPGELTLDVAQPAGRRSDSPSCACVPKAATARASAECVRLLPRRARCRSAGASCAPRTLVSSLRLARATPGWRHREAGGSHASTFECSGWRARI